MRALLSALLLTPGDIVGEDRLLTLAWGADKGSRRALQCAVTRLRTWLRTAVGPGVRLEHAGSGYRLAVPDALARALLRDRTDLLILDEPSAGLDAEAELPPVTPAPAPSADSIG
ncbi:winged helix-turn-helix domain-containing protein [Actinomadura sp. 7K507]|uniref:winged helix-turn-helix domain-containing protein n=1 Tax=Actinomadura sp. 7K507 TaxID=2530365 RepID=UPI00104DBF52|nr:winged helix-turn-helix domain-containing protein [Actinomadura sp. 7K507]TDC79367.1 hypothetical protein E1285_36225 [Actinomadura sp. 7K507]